MHIFHAHFAPSMGGLEQAYVNLTEALAFKGHTVTALSHPRSPYRDALAAHATLLPIAPVGMYDMRAAWRLRRELKRQRPGLIIAHNGRAISLLALAACGLDIPVLGVSHGYKTARLIRADRLVLLTDDMQRYFCDAGYPRERTAVLPNLIRLPEAPVARPSRTPPVIGAMGRLALEKGFADLLDALGLLAGQGVPFSVRIAGDGPLRQALEAQARALGLEGRIRWDGWVHDKAAFYRDIDMLCVPSLSEPFGLVVLEGLAYGVPLVATDQPGPVSLLTHEKNGLLVPRGNAGHMAAQLGRLLGDPAMAARLAEAGWVRAQDFGFEAVADRWDALIATMQPPPA